METLTSSPAAVRTWLGQRALTFKLLGIGALALLLLVPLSMVDGKREERQARYREAISEVTSAWGGAQAVSGPVLIVPYTYQVESEQWVMNGVARVKEVQVKTLDAEGFFTPREVATKAEVTMSVRKRGIYAADVFTAKVTMEGKFGRPTFEFTGVKNVQPQWSRARLWFGLSDVRSANRPAVTWAGESRPVSAARSVEGGASGLEAPAPMAAGTGDMAFAVSLTFNGSGALMFAPWGEQSTVQVRANWADPSFTGRHLPTTRDVSPAGFTAEWQVGPFGRGLPQQWTNEAGAGLGKLVTRTDFEAAAFGVKLAPAVSAYRLVERATKYGLLFVALVFGIFFLFESWCGLRLHGLNYLLVGASVCLFFLGLLALGEVLAFGPAYAAAAGASTALVAGYAWSVLRSGRRAGAVGALLGLVYGYLYLVLGMEDFALLAGTGAMFGLIGLVMWATRRMTAGQGAAVAAGGSPS